VPDAPLLVAFELRNLIEAPWRAAMSQGSPQYSAEEVLGFVGGLPFQLIPAPQRLAVVRRLIGIPDEVSERQLNQQLSEPFRLADIIKMTVEQGCALGIATVHRQTSGATHVHLDASFQRPVQGHVFLQHVSSIVPIENLDRSRIDLLVTGDEELAQVSYSAGRATFYVVNDAADRVGSALPTLVGWSQIDSAISRARDWDRAGKPLDAGWSDSCADTIGRGGESNDPFWRLLHGDATDLDLDLDGP